MRVSAANTQTIGVPTIKRAGNVALRVTDLKPAAHAEPKRYAYNDVRLKTQTTPHALALNSAPQTPQKMSAPLHVLRESPTQNTMPWFVTGMIAAAPYAPQAFKGLLTQAIAVMVAARLAPVILPTVVLATTLFPRQLGDASLYVPIDPSGRKPTDGFKPLDEDHAVLQGVPHTQYTRPPTPYTRELPITDTSEPQLHEGGQRVDIAPVPGKERATSHWTDNILLAHEETPGAASANQIKHPSDQKESLSFSDVEVSRRVVRIPNYSASRKAADNRLDLKFQTGTHGDGAISIHWPEPGDRHIVVVDFEKTSLLPNREAGEVLAHALGYTEGFIPERSLQLKVIDTDTKQLASDDSVFEIARWALAMHGKKTEGGSKQKSSHTGFPVSRDFRTTSYVFEPPVTTSGHAPDGPGLNEQSIYQNTSAYGVPSNNSAALHKSVFYAPDLTTIVRQSTATPPEEILVSYAVIAPMHKSGSPELRLGLTEDVYHHQVTNGHDVYATGVSSMVYDPHFGPDGGYRTQVILDDTMLANATGRNAKMASESSYQEGGLDGANRWVSVRIPVSVDPFAGLQVIRHKGTATNPERYEIRIPDARALEYGNNQLPAHTESPYPDLASLVLEPITEQNQTQRIAHILDIKITADRWQILPTFIGQALEAVQLTDPEAGARQHFTGVRVSQALMKRLNWSVNSDDFVDGLTIYGIENQLGEYSPVVPFVLEHDTDTGHIDFVISPEVSLAP